MNQKVAEPGQVDIIIVEDSHIQAEILRRQLVKEGYHTRVAVNGADAWQQIKALPPTMVISDIEMPEMDGYALCSAIKSDPNLRQIPVILLSSFSDPTDIIRGLHVGADNYVTKPYEPEYLLSRMSSLLQTPLADIEDEQPLEVTLDGKQYVVKTGRQQALNLLISTFENAVRKNHELIRSNEELTVTQEKLRNAVDAERNANEAKRHFLANMSHELRTPMNAIIGYSELLLEEVEEAGQQVFIPDLKNIHTAGKHLLNLINDILDLSKIEAGKMELNLETFDLAHLVNEVAATINPLIDKNNNTLEVHCPENIGTIDNDETRIRQVMLNLLSNAAKFTDQGKVNLSVQTQALNGEPGILITVQDNGIGMTEDQVAKIFDPFVQADNSTSGRYGGTGLGLTICRKFCQMMGGDIFAHSLVGEGSTFTVHILSCPSPNNRSN